MSSANYFVVIMIAVISLSGSTTAQHIDETPIETQSAECTLIAGDVRASAEASVSRKLEGFCATDHLSRAFGNLENRLLSEINHLRSLVNLLLPPLYQQHYFAQPQPQLYQPLLIPTSTMQSVPVTATAILPTEETPVDQVQNESPISEQTSNTSINDTQNIKQIDDSTEAIPISTERILEFRPVQKRQNRTKTSILKQKTGPRDFEIHKFNNTILSGADLQIFTYYWKIEQFSGKLKSNISFLASPVFTISGLHLRVKATLNHLGRDYLYLQLESVSNDMVDKKSNIILKTGDLFKEIQTKVLFRHKIAILDQVTPTSDLTSQEFVNTNDGFLVPNSAILSGPYSKGDSLLIKIVITL